MRTLAAVHSRPPVLLSGVANVPCQRHTACFVDAVPHDAGREALRVAHPVVACRNWNCVVRRVGGASTVRCAHDLEQHGWGIAVRQRYACRWAGDRTPTSCSVRPSTSSPAPAHIHHSRRRAALPSCRWPRVPPSATPTVTATRNCCHVNRHLPDVDVPTDAPSASPSAFLPPGDAVRVPRFTAGAACVPCALPRAVPSMRGRESDFGWPGPDAEVGPGTCAAAGAGAGAEARGVPRDLPPLRFLGMVLGCASQRPPASVGGVRVAKTRLSPPPAAPGLQSIIARVILKLGTPHGAGFRCCVLARFAKRRNRKLQGNSSR